MAHELVDAVAGPSRSVNSADDERDKRPACSSLVHRVADLLPPTARTDLIERLHSGAATMATAQSTEQLIRRMLDRNARKQVQEPGETVMIESIEACVECAQACTACADDSLAETEVTQLIKSITLCLDCAAVCEATRQVVT